MHACINKIYIYIYKFIHSVTPSAWMLTQVRQLHLAAGSSTDSGTAVLALTTTAIPVRAHATKLEMLASVQVLMLVMISVGSDHVS